MLAFVTQAMLMSDNWWSNNHHLLYWTTQTKQADCNDALETKFCWTVMTRLCTWLTTHVNSARSLVLTNWICLADQWTMSWALIPMRHTMEHANRASKISCLLHHMIHPLFNTNACCWPTLYGLINTTYMLTKWTCKHWAYLQRCLATVHCCELVR